ncbi:hypothetical protein CCHR01_18919 [Colletotrichum chrysophilum]|uniref:Uncharacterized protein n=1 Tax=Colletotrichum chrysophilum TaxID=1836956 RepID=A0AAD9E7Q0_9PEZI|nr:hypothetical protein CCHR01_18919 [Colletotrichum chrysophilum]
MDHDPVVGLEQIDGEWGMLGMPVGGWMGGKRLILSFDGGFGEGGLSVVSSGLLDRGTSRPSPSASASFWWPRNASHLSLPPFRGLFTSASTAECFSTLESVALSSQCGRLTVAAAAPASATAPLPSSTQHAGRQRLSSGSDKTRAWGVLRRLGTWKPQEGPEEALGRVIAITDKNRLDWRARGDEPTEWIQAWALMVSTERWVCPRSTGLTTGLPAEANIVWFSCQTPNLGPKVFLDVFDRKYQGTLPARVSESSLTTPAKAPAGHRRIKPRRIAWSAGHLHNSESPRAQEASAERNVPDEARSRDAPEDEKRPKEAFGRQTWTRAAGKPGDMSRIRRVPPSGAGRDRIPTDKLSPTSRLGFKAVDPAAAMWQLTCVPLSISSSGWVLLEGVLLEDRATASLATPGIKHKWLPPLGALAWTIPSDKGR